MKKRAGCSSPDGRLAIWDVTDGAPGELDYPLPWADRPELSHLASADELRAVIEAAGFTVVRWNDLTEQAALFMENFLSGAPGPLGLHTFVDNFAEKAGNLTRALSQRSASRHPRRRAGRVRARSRIGSRPLGGEVRAA